MSQSSPSKNELRKHLKQQRQKLSPQDRINAGIAVFKQLQKLPAIDQAERVAGYWAHQGEVPLNIVMQRLLGDQQTFYLPVIRKHSLVFAAWQMGDEVAANQYGIAEPVKAKHFCQAHALDIVLVPLLGFDRSGNRLGYGGGYYDRSFTFKNNAQQSTPLLVGVAYDIQECSSIPSEPWDIRLDYVVSNRELLPCS